MRFEPSPKCLRSLARVNRIVGVLLLAALLVVGCAGRPANPVMVYQPGDRTRPCDALERELELIEDNIARLLPKTDKAEKNTRLGVAGIFLLVPFFFMDLSKAEQVEINALTKRYNHLLTIGEENGCGFELDPIPDFQTSDY